MGWKSIKSISHNQVIKVSYIVVIGLPIILEIMEVYKIVPKLPLSIKIFFSGLALLITALIYNLFVPKVIKDYQDIHDYKTKVEPDLLKKPKEQHPHIVITHLDPSQREIKDLLLAKQKEISEAEGQTKSEFTNQLINMAEQYYPEVLIKFMEKEWHKSDTKRNWLALYSCYLFITLGFSLAIWVFVDRVITVTNNVPKL